MENIKIIFVIFLSILSIASSLECYSCRDCPEDFKDERKHGSIFEDCPREDKRTVQLGRCSKHIEMDGKINRGCSVLKECTIFELVSKCSEFHTTSCEICCEGNKCNSATALSPALFVSLLLALYLALTFHHV